MAVQLNTNFDSASNSEHLVVEENAKNLLLAGDTNGGMKEFEKISDVFLRGVSMQKVALDLSKIDNSNSQVSRAAEKLQTLMSTKV